jgi:hypothetical protein
MFRSKVGVAVLTVVTCVLATPAALLAQSTIAGVVRDSSGGVLPGVTVEAASEALIEGSRRAVTDGSGQYRIVDLRPGVYSVTFSLEGFSPIKQVGIELPAEFTATVNADMRIGALTDEVIVTGTRPLVDVQSAARVQSLNRDAITNIPSSRTIQTMGQLIPGITVEVGNPDVGGSNSAMQSYMSVRGIPSTNNTVMVDGMAVNGLEANGAIQAYFNDAMSEEIVFQTSNTTASNSGGGVQINMIPRTGGNRFSGDTNIVYRPGELQGNNLTQRLENLQIATPPGNKYISDLNIAQGGPIKRDSLWFFASARDNRVNNYVIDTVFDDGAQGYNAEYIRDVLGRLTWQATPGSKLSGYYDRVWKGRSHAMDALSDPESSAVKWTSPNYSTGAVKYTWTATSRVFVEGGYSFNVERRNQETVGGAIDRAMDDPSMSNAWYASARRAADGADNTSSTYSFQREWPERHNYQGSMSYVTGSHNVKAGFTWESGKFLHSHEAHGDLSQNYDRFEQDPVTGNFRFVDPVSVIVRNTPLLSQESMNRNVGVYLQDQWTVRNFTINGGIRYEHINSQVDFSQAPAGRFVPAREQVEVPDRPNWHDVAPRFSAIWDIFGNGRTALKYSVNRYNSAEAVGLADDYNVLGTSTSDQEWVDKNGDDIAQGRRTWHADGTYTDCDFVNDPTCEIYLSGNAGPGNNFGALPPNFGLPGSTPGYNDLPRTWRLEQGIEVQHQLLARLGLTFGWTRWDRHDMTKQVNTRRQAWDIDYVTTQIFSPITGEPLPFLQYGPTVAAQARMAAGGAVQTFAEPLRETTYNSFQLDFQSQPWAGAQLFGGITFERTLDKDCATSQPGLFVDPNSIRFCNDFDMLGDGSGVKRPFNKDFKISLSMPIVYGFTLSAFYQNIDMGAWDRSYSLSRALSVYPAGTSTHRTASGEILPAIPCPAGQAVCAAPGSRVLPTTWPQATVTGIPLDIPGQTRAERLSQLDFRATRRFRIGRYDVSPTLELFNALNADTILDQTLTYAVTSGNYLRPEDVLKPRTVGFGVVVKW